MSFIKAERLTLSLPLQINEYSSLLTSLISSLGTEIEAALDIILGMANDFTICILPMIVKFLHFHKLSAFLIDFKIEAKFALLLVTSL